MRKRKYLNKDIKVHQSANQSLSISPFLNVKNILSRYYIPRSEKKSVTKSKSFKDENAAKKSLISEDLRTYDREFSIFPHKITIDLSKVPENYNGIIHGKRFKPYLKYIKTNSRPAKCLVGPSIEENLKFLIKGSNLTYPPPYK